MKPLIILILTLSFTGNLLAETTKSNDPTVTDSKSAWEIEKKNLLSPFTTPAIWILGAGSLLTYVVYKAKDDNGDIGYRENHREKTTSSNLGNLAGWGLFQLGYTLTQLPGIYDNDKRALENTEIMWKSTLYTSLTTLVMKLSIKEERRNSEEKYESFPSGHASAAFAFATNVALRHEWYWNFISLPLALWATNSRVEEDSHYIHDSIFGAALGMSFAYGMNYVSGEEVPFLLGYEPMKDGGGVVYKYKC
jgi:membrane-associated phospholipid phosphatase